MMNQQQEQQEPRIPNRGDIQQEQHTESTVTFNVQQLDTESTRTTIATATSSIPTISDVRSSTLSNSLATTSSQSDIPVPILCSSSYQQPSTSMLRDSIDRMECSNSIRLMFEQLSSQINILQAQNRSLQVELSSSRNTSTVSTPNLTAPPITNCPEQVTTTPPTTTTAEITSANDVLFNTAPTVTTTNVPLQLSNQSLPTVTTTNVPLQLSNQSLPTVTTNIPLQSSNQSLPSAETPLLNRLPLPNHIDNTSSISPLQQWLQSNSYHSFAGQTPSSSNNYVNQQLHPLPQFSGEPEKWPLFFSSFTETTRDFRYSNLQNTLRLDKSLFGRARDAVESLLINPSNVNLAISTLEFMFGRPELLLNSQLEKVRNLTEIFDNEIQEFVDFSIKIQNFACYLETIRNSHHHLCNPTLISEIVNKLPITKRAEWMRHSLTILPYPSMRNLADWLNNEAQLLSLVLSSSSRTSIEKRRVNVVDKADPVDSSTFDVRLNQIDNIRKPLQEIRKCELCVNHDRHFLFQCPIFKSKSVDDRWDIVKDKDINVCFSCLKDGHPIRRCSWRKVCGINNCKLIHSRFLHIEPKLNNNSTSIVSSVNENQPIINVGVEKPQTYNCNKESKLYFKIIPIKIYGKDKTIEDFAFIDEGSNTSLIDMDLAVNLGFQLKDSSLLEVKWFNGNKATERTYKVNLEISSMQDTITKYSLSNVKAIKNLDLPLQSIDVTTLSSKFEQIRNLPITYYNAKPKLMIGLKDSALSFPQNAIEIDNFAAIECRLGWYIYGRLNDIEDKHENIVMSIYEKEEDEHLHQIVNNFFDSDNLGITETYNSDENSRSVSILEKTTIQIEGVFHTGLLWKHENIKMPNNFGMALKRLEFIEDKMNKDSEFSKKYEDNLMDYVKKGYARKLEGNEIRNHSGRIWYLPHFSVFNPNKPNKFRIVFDAAAKFQGVSLNSCLYKGPDLNQTLMKVLLNFRVGKIGVCGDIKEMFPQIKIIPEDQHSQRFLWRHGKKEKPVEQYVMSSMIFGASCSPTSAQYIKNLNAKMYQDKHPEAVKTILENHYVDDYVASFHSLEKAVDVTKTVVKIHKGAGFELRKFVSNSKVLLKMIGEAEPTSSSIEKILGLHWDLDRDVLKFKFPFHRVSNEIIESRILPTKRQLLQIVMSIFDPFGILNNYTVHGRLIVQELWKYKIDWDQRIPEKMSNLWSKWMKGLKHIENIEIPRCFSLSLDSAKNVEVHIFTDASDKVFSAIAYLRIVYEHENVDVSMILSKVRIKSQKKAISIPRMELQGAVLGIKIRNMIVENLDFVSEDDFTFWCDSNVVLCWIKSEEKERFKPYVNHRIRIIQESTKSEQWRYVPSQLNVADDATKSKSNNLFPSNDSRWLKGPAFLHMEKQWWPQDTIQHETGKEVLEEKSTIHTIQESCDVNCLINISKYSSFRKIYRVMAWIIKIKNMFLRKLKSSSKTPPNLSRTLTYDDFQDSKSYLFKTVQKICFKEEIESLKLKVPLPKDSSIRRLCPYLDGDGVMRVQGRLENAIYLKFSARHPIILPKDHNLSTLIIRQFHEDLFHQNKQLILNEIRMKYYIPDLKRHLTKVQSKCVYCKIRDARPTQPIMGPLPIERITPYNRAFSYSGIDYCGHYFVKFGKKIQKVWIILFTCMSTRAIHLEVVYNLKSSNCLLAISNFINRRGIPIQIRTDNAGYFLRSKKLLPDIISLADIESNMEKYNIKWVTNTPQSPHMGGAWERLIRCVKRVLDVTVNDQILNFEVFNALVLEAENIVNSRPLTDVCLGEENQEALTPNHFLLGSASTYQNRRDDDIMRSLPKQLRILQQLRHSFWVRWIKEYLPDLTKRSKWFENKKSIQINDLVLICDASHDYKKWTRGRVIKLYPGKDNQVRSVDIQTNNGVLKRAVNKLAVLEVLTNHGGLENVQ